MMRPVPDSAVPPPSGRWMSAGDRDPAFAATQTQISYEGAGFGLVVECTESPNEMRLVLITDSSRIHPEIVREMVGGGYLVRLWCGGVEHDTVAAGVTEIDGLLTIKATVATEVIAAVAGQPNAFWIGVFSRLESVLIQEEVSVANLPTALEFVRHTRKGLAT